MSKQRGPKGRRQSDIVEDEMYRPLLTEERANDATLPSCMDQPSGDWQ
ncbi:hypothetical protein M0R72_21005 [Candidatus Pacearchaeota archaeon]|jgi:hypothetical protein|nr:hypothetical protein [Candidatus Pacearchaeota archaeon]